MLTQWCEDLGRLLLLRHQRMGNPNPMASPDPMNPHTISKPIMTGGLIPGRLQNHKRYSTYHCVKKSLEFIGKDIYTILFM